MDFEIPADIRDKLAELGGQGGSNLAMAAIREHLAARGLGLHNDLRNKSSIVGNFPFAIMMSRFGTEEHRQASGWIDRSPAPDPRTLYQESTCRISSSGLRGPGRNFVPLVYATGISAHCVTSV